MSTSPRAVVIVASTRAATRGYADRTGPLVAGRLREWGYAVTGPVVVPDGPAVGRAIEDALASRPSLLLTTGGTGIAPGDETPEQTVRFLQRQLPGIPEAIRAAGLAAGVKASVLSRGVAGVAGTTLVVNLPGSPGAVRDGLHVLDGVLPHALEQLAGAPHEPPGTARGSPRELPDTGAEASFGPPDLDASPPAPGVRVAPRPAAERTEHPSRQHGPADRSGG